MARKLKGNKGDRAAAEEPRAAAAGRKAPDAARTEPKPQRETLDERQTLRIAKALADPRRMQILRSIAQKSSSCAAMRECLPISAATLSHHMKELETAGLIETSKDGRFVSATLQKKVWKHYIQTLKAIVD